MTPKDLKSIVTSCPHCTGAAPGDIETDKCVISAMMQAPEYAVSLAMDALQCENFSTESCSLLFEIITRRHMDSKPIDPVSVTKELHSMKLLDKVGGPGFVSECYTACPNPAHVRHYAAMVLEASRYRKVMRLADLLSHAGAGTGPYGAWADEKMTEWDARRGAISELIRDLENIIAGTQDSGVRHYRDLAGDYIESFGIGSNRVDNDPPVATGISGLDDALEGGIRKEYIIVSAKSGEGKSLLCYQMAGALAEAGRPGLAVGLEMRNHQVFARDIAREARIPLAEVMGRRDMEDTHYGPLRATLDRIQRTWDVVAMDKPRTSWATVVARARDLHRRGKLQWLAVDYIQLLEVKRAGRERKDEILVQISNEMGDLQKELDITLIAPVQVNAAGEIADASGIIRPAQLLIRIEMEGETDDGHLSIVKQRFGKKNQRIPITREGQFQTFIHREEFSSPEAPKPSFRNNTRRR